VLVPSLTLPAKVAVRSRTLARCRERQQALAAVALRTGFAAGAAVTSRARDVFAPLSH